MEQKNVKLLLETPLFTGVAETELAQMLGCLAAYKGTACLHTAFCNTLDDSGNLFGHILADCNIVKEVERLCTTADNVVYAHRNCVYTDSIMLVH